jgi:intracellular multiplication protein IcmP
MRPACRPLWYFLNAVGGNTVSAEGAAPWAHWNAEKVLGDRITEPVVDSASMALRQAIDDEGWLDMGKKKDKDKR